MLKAATTLKPHPTLLAIFIATMACAGTPSGDPPEASTQPASPPPAAPATASWTRLSPPADLPLDRPLTAGFLIIDGVFNTELTAPYDVFEHTGVHADPLPGIEVFTVSPDGEPITTYEGLEIKPHYGFADAPAIDILVVPSADHSRDSDRQNQQLIAWVRDTGQSARYVMSLCWGAFILAEAGLLDGGAVTTFPSDFDRFAETFPGLDLRRQVSFVHDGKALTSRGGVLSFDVAMYLVDHLYGEPAARGIGGGLLIDWPPAAGTLAALVVDRAAGADP